MVKSTSFTTATKTFHDASYNEDSSPLATPVPHGTKPRDSVERRVLNLDTRSTPSSWNVAGERDRVIVGSRSQRDHPQSGNSDAHRDADGISRGEREDRMQWSSSSDEHMDDRVSIRRALSTDKKRRPRRASEDDNSSASPRPQRPTLGQDARHGVQFSKRSSAGTRRDAAPGSSAINPHPGCFVRDEAKDEKQLKDNERQHQWDGSVDTQKTRSEGDAVVLAGAQFQTAVLGEYQRIFHLDDLGKEVACEVRSRLGPEEQFGSRAVTSVDEQGFLLVNGCPAFRQSKNAQGFPCAGAQTGAWYLFVFNRDRWLVGPL